MANHTPGPWRYDPMHEEIHAPILGSVDCVVVLATMNRQLDQPQGVNGRLMATAPDLLDAAKTALAVAEDWINDQLEGTHGGQWKRASDQLASVRAVIARAEGR